MPHEQANMQVSVDNARGIVSMHGRSLMKESDLLIFDEDGKPVPFGSFTLRLSAKLARGVAMALIDKAEDAL